MSSSSTEEISLEQATTQTPQVRVIVQGPPISGKSAIASRIRLAMEDLGVSAQHFDPTFEELSYGARQNAVQVFRPQVVIHEQTDATAFTKLADEFLAIGRLLAADPGKATASVLKNQIAKMEAALDEMRSWDLVRA